MQNTPSSSRLGSFRSFGAPPPLPRPLSSAPSRSKKAKLEVSLTPTNVPRHAAAAHSLHARLAGLRVEQPLPVVPPTPPPQSPAVPVAAIASGTHSQAQSTQKKKTPRSRARSQTRPPVPAPSLDCDSDDCSSPVVRSHSRAVEPITLPINKTNKQAEEETLTNGNAYRAASSSSLAVSSSSSSLSSPVFAVPSVKREPGVALTMAGRVSVDLTGEEQTHTNSANNNGARGPFSGAADDLFFFHLPTDLPLFSHDHDSHKPPVDAPPAPATHTAAAPVAPAFPSSLPSFFYSSSLPSASSYFGHTHARSPISHYKHAAPSAIAQLPEGAIGNLLVYKSGKMVLRLTNGVSLRVARGVEKPFAQELVAINVQTPTTAPATAPAAAAATDKIEKAEASHGDEPSLRHHSDECDECDDSSISFLGSVKPSNNFVCSLVLDHFDQAFARRAQENAHDHGEYSATAAMSARTLVKNEPL